MHFRGVIKNWFYGSCPGFAGAFPYFGTKVFFPKKSLIFEIACRDRIYEYANLQVLRHLITPESTYFDIGANIGLMSVPILHSHPNSRVVSFEASPKTLDYLYKTHQHSQYRDRWKIIGKAAGTQSGILEFYSSKRAGLDAMNGRKDTHRAAEMESIRVPSTTIDAEWIALNRPNVSVIKLDIEGGESDAILGASHCIATVQPSIMLEWNLSNLKSYGISHLRLLELSNELQYDIYSLPQFASICTPQHLTATMSLTESFLLVSRCRAINLDDV